MTKTMLATKLKKANEIIIQMVDASVAVEEFLKIVL